ncbi:ribonuclease T2 [Dokdonella sp.]|uniref:ribonuclease T2 n=1 Tax=Dokdonella sp. TaxID=2291710 RepID=UPI0025B9EEF9|nr:ribonuclease T2 [Dokdonella sp.]MBX3692785.1 ribonuclease T2 [Dokdonella sp.]MCW5569038.1 ribonuclease T2 [Dokdonella sp.]
MNRTSRAIVCVLVIAITTGIGHFTRPSEPTVAQAERGNARQAPAVHGFDYWLVALSWSPAYCETNPHDREQCGPRGYGFVLHGLWPQYERGGGPQDCPTRERPDAATIARSLAFMPSRRLIEHEWRAHGACSGLDARDYFDLSDRAFASVRIPPAFASPRSPPRMRADDVRNAFVAANPSLRADMFAVVCRGRDLAEVRICVNDDLSPRRCGRDVRTRCPRNTELRIPALR